MTTADRPTGTLGVGKLAPELLSALLARAPVADRRVILGPGIGLDCAVVDLGDRREFGCVECAQLGERVSEGSQRGRMARERQIPYST